MIPGGFLKAVALVAAALAPDYSVYDDREFRKAISEEYGIALVETGAAFRSEELRAILVELGVGPLHTIGPLPSLRVIEKRKGKSIDSNFGSYSVVRRSIRIQEGTADFKRVFLHEYFHALAAARPELFDAFSRLTGWSTEIREGEIWYRLETADLVSGRWVSARFSLFEATQQPERAAGRLELSWLPSEYAKLGPHEMFAETGAAAVYGMELDSSNPYRMASYIGSPPWIWWTQVIHAGGVAP
jgi:hypothetical protein